MARIPQPVPQFSFGDSDPAAWAAHHAGYARSREGYLIVLEKSRTGYGAYSPEAPGCVAVAGTLRETRKLMQVAITFHLRGMRRDGERVPRPRSFTELRRQRLV